MIDREKVKWFGKKRKKYNVVNNYEIYLSGVYIYILIEFIVRCHCLRPIENNIVLSLRISSEKQGIASEELENGTRQVYDKK